MTKTIAQYYDSLVGDFGGSAKAADYGSEISRDLKFIKVFRLLDGLNVKSILDVGCGTGRLYEFLQAIDGDIYYEGIDISPKAISLANKIFNNGNQAFNNIDLENYETTRNFDLVVALGIFYLQERNYEIITANLMKMFSLGNTVFASMKCVSSNSKIEINNQEFHVEPSKIVEIAEKITPYFSLIHDYHNSDMSIILRHKKYF